MVAYPCNMNKQIILKQRPAGLPDASTWSLREQPIPTAAEGQVIIKTHYVSLDPAMRGWIRDQKSYIPPVEIDAVMRAGTIGTVIESRHPKFVVGDVLSGWGGVQQYIATDGEGHFKVDTNLVPMTKYLGALGMPGMTAYFGILDVGKIKEGETVLISGAAGAVGSVAGQIAKIKGCTVIGIAGGPEKCAYVVDQLGFDGCIDYKNTSVSKGLKESCPKGIDVYFDNVGGEILDAALAKLRMYGRVVLCGAISQYNNTEPIQGPTNYLSLLVNRGVMQGLIVFDYAKRYREAGLEMGQWMMEGKLKTEETIEEGIENFLPTFKKLFNGQKKGKLLLDILDKS